jgi:CTP synthase (UTP-ammonia lyase)
MVTSIAVVGDRDTSLPTHRGLDAAIERMPAAVKARWVGSDELSPGLLDGVDGVWLAPGTPYRDDDAVFALLRFIRETGMPFLGTCGGFQYALVEFARDVAGVDAAAHAETDPLADDPVVGRLSCSLVAQERKVRCVPGTRLAAICGDAPFTGFHWCNYGLSERWVATLEDAGLVVSAHADDAGVEGVELPADDHPFFVATLFQPQMAGPDHPLIAAFRAAL